MKIESIIARQLYLAKKVTIQKIGTFYLSPEVGLEGEPGKNFVLPDNAIRFEFDKNAGEDQDLVEFIMKQTKKIKSLAASDLESYSMLAIQFLNIGKPIEIKGIGFVIKSQSGEYEFKQENTISVPAKDSERDVEHVDKKNKSDFSATNRKKTFPKWIVPTTLILITLGAMAYFYIYFDKKNGNKNPAVSSVTNTPNDLKDKTDNSLTNNASKKTDDTIPKAFKIVIKEFKIQDKSNAEKFYKKLSGYGHKVIFYTQDSSSHRIAFTFTRPQKDTLVLKDSLNKFFRVKSFVDFK